MITRRPGAERGTHRLDWLESRFSFSFADYHDPQFMGFRTLKVINDDIFAPGGGFATHPHRDMEIITYVLDGAVEHKDSTGSAGVIEAGDVQRMTAGTGIRHSEYNHSRTRQLRLLQIWILPDTEGLEPGYEQRSFAVAGKRGRLRLIVSADGRDGSLKIHQNVDLYASVLEPGEAVGHELAPGRHAWLQVARGAIDMNGQLLDEGDGAAVSDETGLEIEGHADAEFLLFDLD